MHQIIIYSGFTLDKIINYRIIIIILKILWLIYYAFTARKQFYASLYFINGSLDVIINIYNIFNVSFGNFIKFKILIFLKLFTKKKVFESSCDK